MSDIKISALTSYTTPLSADVIPVVDTANTTTKKVSFTNLVATIAAFAKTLTNTTFDTAGTGNTLKINGTSVTDKTGTGKVVLDTSPTLVTPDLGTPSAGVMTNASGVAASLTAGITKALKSASTTVDVSAATAPSTGQILTATDSTHATWQTPVDITGVIKIWSTASAPSGYLLCDGSAVSRTTYATLFALIGTTYGSGDGSSTFNVPNMNGRMVIGTGTGTKVATFSSRSGDIITVTGLTNANNNEFQTGQAVTYSTSGSVITGLTNNTVYYLIRITNTTFQLAVDLASAQNGTAITLTSDGSGTQTFTQTLTARNLGDTGGEENHAMSSTELLSHNHQSPTKASTIANGTNGVSGSNTTYGTSVTTTNTGGNASMNDMSPFIAMTFIIKT